jgi:NAD(P)-dependent dehydrogenase (short-subunit alcohol dehydrogenase family)
MGTNSMSESFDGQSAIITGAAGGFGRVLTKAFAAAGAKVMAADVAAAGLDQLRDELASAGLANNVTTSVLDISNRAACNATVAAAGKLDILINNGALGMGIISPTHMTDMIGIEDIDPEIWDKFIAVNFTGAWNMTRAVIPAMKAQQWGRIVNVTTSMFTMLRGKFHPYGPSKAGMEAMSAGHAQEFAPDAITVNVVVPGGPSDTPMVPPEAGYERADLIPTSAMVPPILWLCSRAADGVTGNRYIAAEWDASKPVAENRAVCESPAGWPSLAGSPVWPGGKPNE